MRVTLSSIKYAYPYMIISCFLSAFYDLNTDNHLRALSDRYEPFSPPKNDENAFSCHRLLLRYTTSACAPTILITSSLKLILRSVRLPNVTLPGCSCSIAPLAT